MRKTLERGITFTRVEGLIVSFVNGQLEQKPVSKDVTGKVKKENIVKMFDLNDGESFVLISIKEIEKRYEMTIEDFIKYATEIKNDNK